MLVLLICQTFVSIEVYTVWPFNDILLYAYLDANVQYTLNTDVAHTYSCSVFDTQQLLP